MRLIPQRATCDVQLDWDEPSKVVGLHVDQDRIATLSLNPQDVAEALQSLLAGVIPQVSPLL